MDSPTGTLQPGERGLDLVLQRSFDEPPAAVWESFADPDQMAKWFGSWSGTPGPGQTVQLTMGFEEGADAVDAVIERCDPARLLRARMEDQMGLWLVTVGLEPQGAGTLLTFTQHLERDADIASIGPGWEYYLDMLVAARAGEGPPEWSEYWPALKGAYEELAAAQPSAGR